MRTITALSVTAALAVGAISAPMAEAQGNGSRHSYTKFQQKYLHYYWKTARQLGRRAPGRNIVTRGVHTDSGIYDATKRQIAKSIRQLRKLLAPPPQPTLLVRTAVPPTQPPAQVETASVAAGGTLSSIAACESGGNPSAIDASGTYRGKYQFDYGTWASVGGSGDPAAASEAEQDRRAAMLYAQRGGSPWPICSRR